MLAMQPIKKRCLWVRRIIVTSEVSVRRGGNCIPPNSAFEMVARWGRFMERLQDDHGKKLALCRNATDAGRWKYNLTEARGSGLSWQLGSSTDHLDGRWPLKDGGERQIRRSAGASITTEHRDGSWIGSQKNVSSPQPEWSS